MQLPAPPLSILVTGKRPGELSAPFTALFSGHEKVPREQGDSLFKLLVARHLSRIRPCRRPRRLRRPVGGGRVRPVRRVLCVCLGGFLLVPREYNELPRSKLLISSLTTLSTRKNKNRTIRQRLGAQFIAVCRRAKVASMGTRRHRRGSRLCRRCAL